MSRILKKIIFISVTAIFCMAFSSSVLHAAPKKTYTKKAAIVDAVGDDNKVYSKETFELALASKFQLFKLWMDKMGRLNNCFSYLSKLVLEAKEAGDEINEAKQIELLEESGLNEAGKIEVYAMSGLSNNLYVGTQARYIKKLCEENNAKEIEALFASFGTEVRSDMEIAKSLGVNIAQYEEELRQYAFDQIMVSMWAKMFIKSDG